MELVCRFEPEMTIATLKKGDFPLEESLLLCKKSGNKLGQAYLEIKSGRTEEGLASYGEVSANKAGVHLSDGQRDSGRSGAGDGGEHTEGADRVARRGGDEGGRRVRRPREAVGCSLQTV